MRTDNRQQTTDNRQQTTDKPIALPPAAHARTRGNNTADFSSVRISVFRKKVTELYAGPGGGGAQCLRMRFKWLPVVRASPWYYVRLQLMPVKHVRVTVCERA